MADGPADKNDNIETHKIILFENKHHHQGQESGDPNLKCLGVLLESILFNIYVGIGLFIDPT